MAKKKFGKNIDYSNVIQGKTIHWNHIKTPWGDISISDKTIKKWCEIYATTQKNYIKR